MPHAAPSHVATPRAGTGHAVHDVPHVSVEWSSAHVPLQSCEPGGHGEASGGTDASTGTVTHDGQQYPGSTMSC